MQQNLKRNFSDISNKCCFRWLLNERNKPLRLLVNHYSCECFHLFVFNLQRRQTRLKLLEAQDEFPIHRWLQGDLAHLQR